MVTVWNIIIVFCEIVCIKTINKIITALAFSSLYLFGISPEVSQWFSFPFNLQSNLTTLSFMSSRFESSDLQVICALLLYSKLLFIFLIRALAHVEAFSFCSQRSFVCYLYINILLPILGAERAKARKYFQHPLLTSKPATMTQECSNRYPSLSTLRSRD